MHLNWRFRIRIINQLVDKLNALPPLFSTVVIPSLLWVWIAGLLMYSAALFGVMFLYANALAGKSG
jgi:hypothetical protein